MCKPKPTKGSRAFRQALRARQLTLDDAAALFEVDRQTIWRWVYGRNQPSVGAMRRIEKEFRIGYELWLEIPDDLA